MKKTLLLLATIVLVAGSGMAQQFRAQRNVKAPVLDRRMPIAANVMHSAKAAGDTVYTLPWEEGFENDDWNWTFVNGNTNDDGFAIVTNGDYEYTTMGENCLFATYNDYADVDQWAISPVISMSQNSDDTLFTFFIYMTEYEGIETSFEVRVSTTGADTASFSTVLYSETGVSNAFVKRSVSLAAYAGQNIRIAIHNITGAGGDAMLVDDLRIGSLQEPSLSIVAPTTAISGTPVVFTAMTDATEIEWEVDGTVMTETSNVLTHTFTTTGSHSVKATATNDAGSTESTVSINVIECNSIAVPTQFDFSDGISLCWENTEGNWDTLSGLGEVWVYSMSAINYYNYFIIDNECDNWLITQNLNIATAGSYQVEWDVLEYAQQYATDHYTVCVINGTDTSIIFEETLTAAAAEAPQHRIAALPSNLTGDFKIAFHHYESTGGYVLLISNFEVAEQGAPVVSINGPASGITDSPMVFNAISYTATSYNWTVDGSAVNETSATLTHTFTTAGTHTVSVVANNSFGSSTPATASIEIISCEAITNFPWTEDFENEASSYCWSMVDGDGDGFNWEIAIYEGVAHNNSNGMMMSASYDPNSGNALNPDNWLISPAIVMPEGANFNLTWSAKGQDTSAEYCSEHYFVYIGTSNTPSSFSNPVYESTTTGQWQTNQVSLAQYAGQTIYVAFRHAESTDKFYLDIDDVSISGSVITGISEAKNIDFSVYPNPTTDVVRIEATGISQVELIDINGRTLATTYGNSLDLTNLATGTYIVRVVTADGVGTQRIVKQ